MDDWLTGARSVPGGLLIPGAPEGLAVGLLLTPDQAEVWWQDHRLALPWDRFSRTRGPWLGPGNGKTPGGWSLGWHRLRMRFISRGNEWPWGAAVVLDGDLRASGRDLVCSVPRNRVLGPAFTRSLRGLRTADVVPLNVRGWLDSERKDRASRSTARALVAVLAGSPNLRLRLAEEERTTRLAKALGTRCLDFVVVEPPAGFRRQAAEIGTAMRALGYQHPFGRPLDGDHLPPLDDAVTRVLGYIAANPYAAGVTIDRDRVSRIVSRRYLDVAPWPFESLTD